jgi:hypothetical protein
MHGLPGALLPATGWDYSLVDQVSFFSVSDRHEVQWSVESLFSYAPHSALLAVA